MLSTLYSETISRIGTLCNLTPLNLSLEDIDTLQTLEQYWVNLFCQWGNGVRDASSSFPAVRQLFHDTKQAVITTHSFSGVATSNAQEAIVKAQEFWPAQNLEIVQSTFQLQRENARYRHHFRYNRGRRQVLGENALLPLGLFALMNLTRSLSNFLTYPTFALLILFFDQVKGSKLFAQKCQISLILTRPPEVVSESQI